MLERTYTAKHMGEALSRIKRELGPDAVILSYRELRDLRDQIAVEVKAAPFAQLERRSADQLSSGAAESRAASLERRLIASGVPVNTARTLCMRVRRELREHGRGLIEAFTNALRAEITFAPRLQARVVALVGPTGVGKTTTVAKLAAIAALVERRSVALVCVDQFRVGASEQLQRYADLIGIPMESAEDGRTLERSLRKLSRAELVLIDTAGRSPRDTQGIAATAQMLHEVSEVVEVHLCLAAATREAELTSTLERYLPLAPSRLISTKLDEALTCGGVLSARVQSELPLSFFTTGQCVPEDIEAASAEALAAVLCGEEVQ